METIDKAIWVLMGVMILMVVITVHNIFTFMPVEKQCESSFKIINDCKCIPDAHLEDLFNIHFVNGQYVQGKGSG
jgi:hypothetical protein